MMRIKYCAKIMIIVYNYKCCLKSLELMSLGVYVFMRGLIG